MKTRTSTATSGARFLFVATALVFGEPELAEFVHLALRGHKAKILTAVERSTHGTCRLATDKVRDFVIGIPPLAEQRRIIARVDQLLGLYDQLEAATRNREELGEKLARALSAVAALPRHERERPLVGLAPRGARNVRRTVT